MFFIYDATLTLLNEWAGRTVFYSARGHAIFTLSPKITHSISTLLNNYRPFSFLLPYCILPVVGPYSHYLTNNSDIKSICSQTHRRVTQGVPQALLNKALSPYFKLM